ncbi:39S ribosomal protein L42, mitochondrial [Collichthys lucidus]|uniref:Large ribosomal subunit protein mL42 n=1 Tax=Collichthys lucidus TaxID=240159 RepID=A0A4U5VPZ7_COLLU|nr:39S ribosomal protein L42, mitochondrial [Collichthys lucidus]
MASGHLCRLHSLLTRISNATTLRAVQTCLVPMRQKSSISGPSLDSSNCNVEIGVTSDGKTIVCYHPAADIPYELTQDKQIAGNCCRIAGNQHIILKHVRGSLVHDSKSLQPIERPDPVTNTTETHDQVLKAHLSKEVLRDKPGPTIEELSKMFFTTKHRWYPLGQ